MGIYPSLMYAFHTTKQTNIKMIGHWDKNCNKHRDVCCFEKTQIWKDNFEGANCMSVHQNCITVK